VNGAIVVSAFLRWRRKGSCLVRVAPMRREKARIRTESCWRFAGQVSVGRIQVDPSSSSPQFRRKMVQQDSAFRVTVAQYSDRGVKPDNEDALGCLVPEEPELSRKGMVALIADGVSSA